MFVGGVQTTQRSWSSGKLRASMQIMHKILIHVKNLMLSSSTTKNNANPRHSPIIVNTNKKYSIPSCVTESDSHIAPLELNLTCDFWIESNNVHRLECWIMVLFCMHLFLNGDEIMDLGFFILMEENAIHNNNGTISGLFVQILGKNKKQKSFHTVTMML